MKVTAIRIMIYRRIKEKDIYADAIIKIGLFSSQEPIINEERMLQPKTVIAKIRNQFLRIIFNEHRNINIQIMTYKTMFPNGPKHRSKG